MICDRRPLEGDAGSCVPRVGDGWVGIWPSKDTLGCLLLAKAYLRGHLLLLGTDETEVSAAI